MQARREHCASSPIKIVIFWAAALQNRRPQRVTSAVSAMSATGPVFLRSEGIRGAVLDG